ncbi:DNA phosphorothioation-associated putative methyltransferase [Oceanisphaera sp. W20_SRM_FM3]|uniref:DNA phosphorothioation-associated putative methyltransferase n=1 Tax=Oceanisphaera sp. W20_SRM_FM3 TaxID=3240267 RepID=UPI003F9A9202
MLNFEKFKQLVSALPYKKELPDAVYLHRDTLQSTDATLSEFVIAVAAALKIKDDEWNLVKLSKREFKLSLLHYPEFFTDAYPAIARSTAVDLVKLSHKVTHYQEKNNPPILHRKETFLCPNHPQVEEFTQITQEGEAAGLYENSRMIGFRDSWERLIEQHGYKLVDGRLFRISSVVTPQCKISDIDRHRTALVRYQLSAPMKTLARHGYLNGEYSLFDYGCGRGDDLRELEAHGIDALGWDPNFLPDAEKISSDLVNIGYVINVIEDLDERIETLINAWELTNTVLVVSAMIANENFIAQFTPYKDGVITSRNTFQRYYSQAELKAFIEQTLDSNAIAIGPGIFYVFKDEQEEQRFLANRQRRHHGWQQLTAPKVNNEEKARLLVATNQPLFEAFWQRALTLGRVPANDEFEQSAALKAVIGSHRKAMSLLEKIYDISELEQSKTEHQQDLLVYLALNLFGKRKPYAHYSTELQRDLKALFGHYKEAQEQAYALLFSIADHQAIESACHIAHQQLPASLMHAAHSLIFHKDYLPQLPSLLRVYVGAACQLYGELEDIDLIKIHITSGKVSLMGYDNFEKPIPYLVERIKIKMADQDVDFFDYVNESKRPPLLYKSKLMSPEHKDYKKQISFERRLLKRIKIDITTTPNINRLEFGTKLLENEIVISNFTIKNKPSYQ